MGTDAFTVEPIRGFSHSVDPAVDADPRIRVGVVGLKEPFDLHFEPRREVERDGTRTGLTFGAFTVASSPLAGEYLAGDSGVLISIGYAVLAGTLLYRHVAAARSAE
jgi:hypothetical protein